MKTDKELATAVRTIALLAAGERGALLTQAADRLDESRRGISAGHYTLSRWEDGDFWLNNDETGEGMGMSEVAVLDIFESIWKEY